MQYTFIVWTLHFKLYVIYPGTHRTAANQECSAMCVGLHMCTRVCMWVCVLQFLLNIFFLYLGFRVGGKPDFLMQHNFNSIIDYARSHLLCFLFFSNPIRTWHWSFCSGEIIRSRRLSCLLIGLKLYTQDGKCNYGMCPLDSFLFLFQR